MQPKSLLGHTETIDQRNGKTPQSHPQNLPNLFLRCLPEAKFGGLHCEPGLHAALSLRLISPLRKGWRPPDVPKGKLRLRSPPISLPVFLSSPAFYYSIIDKSPHLEFPAQSASPLRQRLLPRSALQREEKGKWEKGRAFFFFSRPRRKPHSQM